MMRWNYVELPLGDYPAKVATKHGNGWVVLQQQVTVYYPESSTRFAGDYTEWQDVPLHIEKSDK